MVSFFQENYGPRHEMPWTTVSLHAWPRMIPLENTRARETCCRQGTIRTCDVPQRLTWKEAFSFEFDFASTTCPAGLFVAVAAIEQYVDDGYPKEKRLT
jgi:hypothetical protein